MRNFLLKNPTKLLASVLALTVCLAIGGASLSAVKAVGSGNYGLDNIAPEITGTDGLIDAGSSPDLKATIGKIIVYLLGFLGIIFLILIIYAGFLWMTAGGDGDQVSKAQDLIKAAIIGVIIILCAYVITRFVFTDIRAAIE